jgi:hypothetical protein
MLDGLFWTWVFNTRTLRLSRQGRNRRIAAATATTPQQLAIIPQPTVHIL